MKARIFMLGLGAAVLTLVSLAGAESALTFNYKDVVVPGSTETDTYGINDAKMIAGDYVDAAGAQHGMLKKGSNVITIDKPECVTSPGTTGIQLFGVNNKGVGVGWCSDTNGAEIAFRYNSANSKLTNIKIKGAQLMNANGINDAGNVVGTYIDAHGLQHGFLLVGTKLTKLDPPGVVALATAFGINNKGAITIYGQDANGTYVSFITKDKGATYKQVHAPDEGPVGTAIHHINDNGDYVATYFDADSARHGLLWHAKKFTEFDNPDGVGSTRGNGINKTLGIVGRYVPSDGTPPDQGYFAQVK